MELVKAVGEERSEILGLLPALPQDEALILRLRYLEEKKQSLRAIGQQLRLSPEGVRLIERKAIERLRKKLAVGKHCGKFPEQIPVKELELSRRAQGVLRRLKVKALADLTRLSRKDLLPTKNCGRKTIAEIQACVESYGLSLTKGGFTSRRQDDSMRVSESEYLVAQVHKPHAGKNRKEIGQILVKELGLSVRAQNVLRRLGVKTLADLIQLPTKTLLDTQNCGPGTLKEIQANLQSRHATALEKW